MLFLTLIMAALLVGVYYILVGIFPKQSSQTRSKR